MKKIIPLLLITVFSLSEIQAQNQQPAVDSASLIIDNYLKLLNHDAVKSDSMLYIESIIVSRNIPGDTTLVKRWFMPPYSYRTELWHDGTLTYGLVTDGRTVHRRLDHGEKRWEDISISDYVDDFMGYDFHGPFHHYKMMGLDIQYKGVWKMMGNDVYKIFVEDPQRNDRYYLFEKESGLLFLIDETNVTHKLIAENDSSHVDWRAYHEFTPIGDCLFPTIESYQYKGDITMIYSKVRYEAIDEKLFRK